MTESYHAAVLHFPSVIREVKYTRQLHEADRRSLVLTVDEALHLLRQYCAEMNLGIEYDRRIRQPWNADNPNCLTEQNLTVARLIHAQGFRNDDLADLLNRPIAALAEIPLDGDLFATEEHDRAAAMAMGLLDEFKGINVANATKLLHQKRPGMFPILDSFVRRAIGLCWPEAEGQAGYQQLLREYRAFLKHDENTPALQHIIQGLGEAETEHFVGKPRVRVLDALAWSVIYYQDPFRL